MPIGQSAGDAAQGDRDRPVVVLTCYHFHPSIAVASRRMVAVARAIAGDGLDVIVVSEFGGHEFAAGEPLWPGVHAHSVPQPPRLLVGLLVRLKRWLLTHPGQSPAIPSDDRALAEWDARIQDETGGFARLRVGILRLVDVVDSHKKWAWLAYRRAIKAAKGRDVRFVFASGPPFSGLISAWQAARVLRVPLVIDLRDPMATRGPANERRSALKRWLLARLERRLVRRAAAVTCTSPGIFTALLQRYPGREAKIHLVMNGFDGDVQSRSPETGHSLNILFAGALYLNRDPFPLLESLERLLTRPGVDAHRVRLRFVGDCASYNGVMLADWLEGRRAQSVVDIVPMVTPEELQPFMERSTVLLNLAQGQPHQIPAKTFEQLASGREILTICEADSDTGRLLEGVPGVFRLSPGDSAALDAALADLYQRHVIEGQLRPIPADRVLQFSRQSQTAKLLAIARSLGTGR